MEIQTRKWRSLRHKMAPSSGMIRVSRSPVIPNWLQKTLFRPWKLGQACAHTADVLHANSFSLATAVCAQAWPSFQGQACAHTADVLHANSFSLATAVKNSTQKGGKLLIFSNPFSNPGPLEFSITPDRLYEHILFYSILFLAGGFFMFLNKSISLRMLRICFAVKLRECFVDYETPLDFPSAWRWLDTNFIFMFGLIYPLSYATTGSYVSLFIIIAIWILL